MVWKYYIFLKISLFMLENKYKYYRWVREGSVIVYENVTKKWEDIRLHQIMRKKLKWKCVISTLDFFVTYILWFCFHASDFKLKSGVFFCKIKRWILLTPKVSIFKISLLFFIWYLFRLKKYIIPRMVLFWHETTFFVYGSLSVSQKCLVLMPHKLFLAKFGWRQIFSLEIDKLIFLFL